MNVHWRKSTFSTGVHDETCVELARLDARVGVRDSKNPAVGHLTFSRAQFAELSRRLRGRR